MKLQLLSDLHIDSYAKRDKPLGHIPKTAADIILVAGDTANSDKGMAWLQQQAMLNETPVVTIAGNHEYFSEDILCFDQQLAQWDTFDSNRMSGLKVLQCDQIDIQDVRILGCNLWTDYQFGATEETREVVMSFMRDYRQIYAGEQLFSPEISVQIHAQHRAWLKQALIEAHSEHKKVVVMIHHSVTPRSVSQRYAGMPSNAAFVSDLSAWMHKPWAPKLWLHGHTHEAFDYIEGNTRVIVNPRAYPGEVSSTQLEFDWSKMVEV
ncbi:metallophosphoesterase [Psychrobacter sp. H7-1]|uniref:metallophosphoesterase n=1 Tax=Psychrobacter sp. H7-1 TaxID=1569265 RepID=UPI00191B0C50|nr:metallophosphoesterase [Psychrobacter sp. H7-1]